VLDDLLLLTAEAVVAEDAAQRGERGLHIDFGHAAPRVLAIGGDTLSAIPARG
jgi:hypothetical protein